MTPTLLLAPLRGITESPFRTLFTSFFPGFDLAVAPFINTYQGNRIKPTHLQDLLPENNPAMPVVPQILSKNPDNFISVARILCDLGYTTLNWNLGCPWPMVANKMRGSGLLPYPDKIDAFLEKVHTLPATISIKTRLGRRDSSEIFDLLPVFNRYPLSEVIIHPRTGIQMYGGTVDLDIFGRCLEICRHPVVYNGDIICLADFKRLALRFPQVSAWMIGRGALANPFLPAQIKGMKLPDDPMAIISAYHDALFALFSEKQSGPGHILGHMKGIWLYLAPSFSDGKKLLKKIQKTRTIERYTELMETIFTSHGWQPPQTGGI
ncbi:MAG: tRNA-dihydrouridine synthase family protein [Pseudomonadota bacterium]